MSADPYRYFRVEARDLLDQLGRGVLELEKGVAGSDRVARLLRLAHTLKGAARVVKAREVADRAHAIEDALAPFREAGVPLPRDRVDVVLKLLDEISAQTAALTRVPEPGAEGSRSNPQQDVPKILQADVQELDALVEGVVEATVQLASVRRISGKPERARRLAVQLDEQIGSTRSHRPLDGAAPKIRPAAAELRAVIEGLQRDFVRSIEQIERELQEVRETAERLRLIPASILFGTLERAARDAAQSLGKRVAFVANGGSVRLEAQVLSVVQNALVQAVRNAVAHGFESEADRLAAGKKAEGRLSVEIRQKDNRVSFTCRDDGRGVDLDAVRRAAQRKGIGLADTQTLSGQELLDLLLKGGLTTAGTPNEIAGRGVGLDVVRESASRLGGEVSVQTETGMGTTIELVVPVSLSSLDALVVEASGRTAAIPIDSVRRTIRLTPAQLTHTAEGVSVPFDGTVVPFSPLSRALRVGTDDASLPRAWSAVVVRGEDALCALGVDRLRGTQTVVVRRLPDLAPTDSLVAGAFLDAEGNPQLVLEPEGLVKECLRNGPLPRGAPTSRPAVLVIDDSLTTRMLEGSILESAGYEVELATSGEEALEKASRRRFALFLVDVEMPGMDGFEFIERTRAHPTLREVPAVLITSRSSPEDRSKGARIGAAAYIVKSEFDQGELLERIRVLVSS